MAKTGEITPRVQRMIELLRAGVSPSNTAQVVGVSARAARDVAKRYRLSRQVGRPQLATELSAEQQRLVVDHMKFARGCARRCLRLKSRARDWDESEYISCAYLGLVKAASRWNGSGRFKRLVAKWVDGTIADFRRSDMLANGWSFDSSSRKIAKLVRRVPDRSVNGESGVVRRGR